MLLLVKLSVTADPVTLSGLGSPGRLAFRSASASRTSPGSRYHRRPACVPDFRQGYTAQPGGYNLRMALYP
jgi:hypothetical protein